MRDRRHLDGDCFPGRDEMDHQRRRTGESSIESVAFVSVGGGGVSASARVQRAADCPEQHV